MSTTEFLKTLDYDQLQFCAASGKTFPRQHVGAAVEVCG